MEQRIMGSSSAHISECELPLRQWSRRTHRKMANAIEESFIQEDQYPTYQPSGEDTDDTDHSDYDNRPQAPIKSGPSLAANKRPGTTSTPSIPPTKQQRQHMVDVDPNDDSQTVTTPTHPKRQHHAQRLCPVCGKQESNLKRHLKSHARKGLINDDEVEKLLSIAIHKGKRHGPRRQSRMEIKKGLKLKWCPYEGCQIATHYLQSHLTHFHRIQPGALLENHLRVAREYQGMREVSDIQQMIRSRRSAVKEPSSTTTTISPTSSTSTSISNPPQPSTPNSASVADLSVP